MRRLGADPRGVGGNEGGRDRGRERDGRVRDRRERGEGGEKEERERKEGERGKVFKKSDRKCHYRLTVVI